MSEPEHSLLTDMIELYNIAMGMEQKELLLASPMVEVTAKALVEFDYGFKSTPLDVICRSLGVSRTDRDNLYYLIYRLSMIDQYQKDVVLVRYNLMKSFLMARDETLIKNNRNLLISESGGIKFNFITGDGSALILYCDLDENRADRTVKEMLGIKDEASQKQIVGDPITEEIHLMGSGVMVVTGNRLKNSGSLEREKYKAMLSGCSGIYAIRDYTF